MDNIIRKNRKTDLLKALTIKARKQNSLHKVRIKQNNALKRILGMPRVLRLTIQSCLYFQSQLPGKALWEDPTGSSSNEIPAAQLRHVHGGLGFSLSQKTAAELPN